MEVSLPTLGDSELMHPPCPPPAPSPPSSCSMASKVMLPLWLGPRRAQAMAACCSAEEGAVASEVSMPTPVAYKSLHSNKNK